MSLLLPDIIMQEVANITLDVIRDDYNSIIKLGENEEKSILFQIFGGLVKADYDYFEQGKALLITKPDNPKHIRVKLSYDPDDKEYPSVHISLPSESKGETNSLGDGEGDSQVELDNDSNLLVLENNKEWRKTFNKSFKTNYNLVILGSNKNEVVLLYSLFRAGFIAASNHMALLGLRNVQLGGSDLRWDALIAPGIHNRIMSIDFDYEVEVPEWLVQPVINSINFQYQLVDKLTL